MNYKNNARYIIIGCTLFFLSAAIAESTATNHNLEKLIHKNADQSRALDAAKYNRVAVLAGEKLGELEKRRDEVANAYKKWAELKSSAEASGNPGKFKAVETAAQAYSQANLAFVNLQKEILVNSGIVSDDIVLSDVVNALNAAAPSAAGRQPPKPNNAAPNSSRSGNSGARPASP